MENLVSEIRNLQEKLNNLIFSASCIKSDGVMDLSTELDRLIAKYYKMTDKYRESNHAAS